MSESTDSEVAALRRVIFQVRHGLGLIALGHWRDHDAAGAEDARRIELAIARCDEALARTAVGAGSDDIPDIPPHASYSATLNVTEARAGVPIPPEPSSKEDA